MFSFGLDMVIKYVFFKGRIYRKAMFMLNDFRIDLFFYTFLSHCDFVFTLQKN